jgi:hypothetical protein
MKSWLSGCIALASVGTYALWPWLFTFSFRPWLNSYNLRLSSDENAHAESVHQVLRWFLVFIYIILPVMVVWGLCLERVFVELSYDQENFRASVTASVMAFVLLGFYVSSKPSTNRGMAKTVLGGISFIAYYFVIPALVHWTVPCARWPR